MVNVLRKYWQCLFMITILSATGNIAVAQNNGLIQDIDIMDTYRIFQLTDSVRAADAKIQNRSFTIRPLILSPVEQKKAQLRVSLDQVSFSTYYNDSLGTGYNNGSFFQATGWQQRFSVGASIQYGRLLVRMQPELVLAENKVQATISNSFNDADYFSRYYYMNINVIDLPSRYGKGQLSKLYPGQSSVRFLFNKHISAGISTENIWWGPGINNSLVMTNNAPGFLHATIQTDEPVKTSIGSFEIQAIYGRLDSSGVVPVENEKQFARFWPGAYVPKISESNRDIAGMIVTWQPKWIKNLYIGFATSTYFYTTTSDSLGKPFPDYPWTASRKDQNMTALGSVFFRYAMPGDQAEVYAEAGRGDKPATLFNLFGDTIPFAYSAGLRKFFSLKKKGQFIEVSAELTHLQLPDPRLIYDRVNTFNAPQNNGWYTHPRIRQGYTNSGQLLGAGIGPGSNSQNLNISWVDRFNKLGIHLERVIHNEDFYYYHYLTGIVGYGYTNRHWTDLSIGFHGQFTYKGLLFSAAYTNTSALNYQWVKVDGLLDGPSTSDKRNHHFAFSIAYPISRKPLLLD